MAEVGQTVAAGQALARLDPADFELAVRAAEDQLQAARVDAEQAASDEARFRRLLADHSVSVADHERQKARADAAIARQAQASRQLNLARNQSKYATLVAEFNGVITSIRFEVGQVVAEGMPVITVAKQSELEVVADLPEEMAGSADSMAASATFWGGPNLGIPLKLRELSPVASAQTRTYRGRFSILDKSPATRQALHLGMTSNLHLTQKDSQLAAVLPATAVWKTNGKSMIWQVNNLGNKLAAQPVEVIRYTDEAVLVQGLPDGTRVVSAGIQKLASGLDVVPVERSASGMNLEIPPPAQASVPGRRR
jgi:RND family efflux transporter MFP subunit